MRKSLHVPLRLLLVSGLVIPLVTALFILDQKPAHACSCGDIDEYYTRSELVFRGVVVEGIEYSGQRTRGKFLVDTVWRGPAQRTVYVHSSTRSECGFIFQEGAEYMVAASQDWSRSPGWGVGLCTVWPQEYLAEMGTMDKLGRGKTPPAVQLDRATPLLLTVMPWVKIADPGSTHGLAL